ncbi:MAG: DUF1015 domain-containing protein [Acidobacteria bacterium]|nr:DUF1015 domain-containing protein [Acidobacteriota bacterium]
MRIYGFQGYRFSTSAGDAGQLAAPPFDQIDDSLRDELQASARHHFAHLTRPLPGEEGDPYRHAAALHRSWFEDGTVARDPEPCLYPYVIESPDGVRRLGLCTLVGVEDPSSNVIRPHESTLDKPFADRLNLLRTTRIDLEPVMFLSDDPGTLEEMLRQDLAHLEPVARHRDAAGNVHSLFRVSGADRITGYQEALSGCSAAIADGHHRYKVGRTYAEEIGAAPGTGAAAKMAVLFSLSSKHLVIDPIHRGFAEAPDLSPLYGLLRSRESLEVSSGEALAAAVAAAPQPALGVLTREGAELWGLDPARLPEGCPPGSERLAVVHLHSHLLPLLGFSQASYLDGTVSYRAIPATLFRQVRSGELALGIFLPPMSAEAFGEAISKGDLLPAKATRFLPKLASGLVWAGHDAQLI